MRVERFINERSLKLLELRAIDFCERAKKIDALVDERFHVVDLAAYRAVRIHCPLRNVTVAVFLGKVIPRMA